MTKVITREDLQSKIERGDDFTLVEILPEDSYRHTHLPTAVNLPPDRIAELASEVLPDKAAEIVVYCANPN